VKVESNGGMHAVDIAIEPIQEPETLRGTVMVVFTEGMSGNAKLPGKARRTATTPAALAAGNKSCARRATNC